MIRFKSLTSRIVFLHIMAVALTAIVLPLVLFFLLNSEISQLHRVAMRDQADAVARELTATPDGKLALVLPASLRDQYSEAYGRYAYDVVDAAGRVLFSSRSDRKPILPDGTAFSDQAFQGESSSGSMIAGASVHKQIAGQTVRVRVAEDLAHRDEVGELQ